MSRPRAGSAVAAVTAMAAVMLTLTPLPASALEICVSVQVGLPPLDLSSIVDVEVFRPGPRCLARPAPHTPPPPVPSPSPPVKPTVPTAPTVPATTPLTPVPSPRTRRMISTPPARPAEVVPTKSGPEPPEPSKTSEPPEPSVTPSSVPPPKPSSHSPRPAVTATKELTVSPGADATATKRRWAVATIVLILGAGIAARGLARRRRS